MLCVKSFSTNTNSNWNQDDILKREARGPYGIVDFEVQEVTDEYIITEKGSVDKERYYFPKYLVDYLMVLHFISNQHMKKQYNTKEFD